MTEKLRINIPLVLLVSITISIIVFTSIAMTWKNDVDNINQIQTDKQIELENNQKEIKKTLAEQINLLTKMNTDIEWIKKALGGQ